MLNNFGIADEVETLEPSLKLMVEDYAEYAGMSNLSVAGFQFKLTATNPTNPSATQFGLFRWSFLIDEHLLMLDLFQG